MQFQYQTSINILSLIKTGQVKVRFLEVSRNWASGTWIPTVFYLKPRNFNYHAASVDSHLLNLKDSIGKQLVNNKKIKIIKFKFCLQGLH